MLHIPTSERKTDAQQNKSSLAPVNEQALHSYLLHPASPYSLNGMGSRVAVCSPEAQQRQTLAGLQTTHGNQSVLRMLQNPQRAVQVTPLRPSQGSLMQRKCACGGTAGPIGECAECKQKREGEEAVSALLQTKLKVSQPGDPYEREADRVAEQVMRMTDSVAMQNTGSFDHPSPHHIQRLSPQTEEVHRQPDEEEEEETLQAKEAPSLDPTVTPELLTRIHSLQGGGQPLPEATRAFMEPRFGHDFSRVRVHTDARAAESARAVNALAYTFGRDLVFSAGQYTPGTSAGKRLLAHELTHVVQQGPESQSTLQRETDVADAGVPLPGGVPLPPEVPVRFLPVATLLDSELGPEYVRALKEDENNRAREIEDEIDRRVDRGFGLATPVGSSPRVPGNKSVTPEVALKVLDNLSSGNPPFRPDLSKGGVEWIVTEGSPYTGIDVSKSIDIEVEVTKSANPLVFKEKELKALNEKEMKATEAEAEAKFRENLGLDKDIRLSNRLIKALRRFKGRFAESRMWDRIGELVRKSPGKAGEVIFEVGSDFSKTPGKFAVVADASKIQVKGGAGRLAEVLSKAGVGVEPVVAEAVEAMAKKLKWAGRVRGAFRYGGRILIVVALTYDVYKIIRAKDKTKAVITTVTGWGGATAAGAAFAALWTPADVAGPLAWAVHGVGTLVAGAIGYWIGSETSRIIYEMVVESSGE
jgi:hypothetical protein